MNQTLPFAQPLRGVRLAAAAGPMTPEMRVAERERASYERGLRDGEQAMNERLMRQRRELAELQDGVLRSLREAVPRVVRDSENALIALAVEVAQKLVANIPITAETVEACVREALSQVEESAEFTILLHPEDLALLRRHNSALLGDEAAHARMHFQSSPEVTRGGCLVRSRFGVVDARRETRAELLRKALLS